MNRFIIKLLFILFIASAVIAQYGNPRGRGPRPNKEYGTRLFQFQVYNFAALEEDNKTQVNFHFSLVNDLLTFVQDEGDYKAGYEINAIILDQNKEILAFETTSAKVNVKEFEQTNARLKPHPHKLSFHLNPGKYKYEIQVYDDETGLILERKKDLVVRNFSSNAIHMSDIIFANKLDKGEVSFQYSPNLNAVFNDIESSSAAYFEIYPPENSDSIAVATKILNKQNQKIFSELQKFGKAETIPVAVRFREHIQKPGEYFLHIHTTDGKRSASIQRKFNVHWANIPLRENNINVAIEQVGIIAKKDVVSKILNAPDEDKKQLFDEFWKERDPSPGTPRNELREEFFRRVDFANKNFSEVVSNRTGWETDRGEVYVKNGAPDSIERNATEMNMPSAEIWFYSKLNRKYIFSDRSGKGVYRLVKID
jgi:GWxTD domain-containing protein